MTSHDDHLSARLSIGWPVILSAPRGPAAQQLGFRRTTTELFNCVLGGPRVGLILDPDGRRRGKKRLRRPWCGPCEASETYFCKQAALVRGL